MKRGFDIFISCSAIFLLLPIILVVIISSLLLIRRPILFCQKRPGLNGQPFIMYKFRTMLNDKDNDGKLLSDIDRLTNYGKFLRSTSLDELPGLLNVLKGEMSLVGPRPLLMQYLPLYSPEQARRHAVKPGITGWAQVNGRNAISWEEKFKLDNWYVDNQSLALDIKILIMTVIKVFKSSDINAKGEATMPMFKGEGR